MCRRLQETMEDSSWILIREKLVRLMRDHIMIDVICGQLAKLTEDHVPPKFWHNSKEKRYSLGLGLYDPSMASHKLPWKGRKGIVFSSLCSDCNNRVLGSTKDRALKEFCDQVKSQLFHNTINSQYTICNIDANMVAKGVVGHLLAAKDFYDDQSLIDRELRQYVLDDSALPPENMQLLFFYYPWKQYIVVGRDIVVSQLGKTEGSYKVPDGVISCLYSFPLAFILTDSKQELHLRDLFEYCRNGRTEKQNVFFNYKTMFYPGTSEVRNYLWPIRISKTKDGISMLMGGQSLRKLIIGVGDE